MTDKKTFGSFIKAKRTERKLSQKELADQLFVTEGAVSKWERGVSFPDITLLADICRILNISEHELITASDDTEAGRLRHEARRFRTIRNTWFWIPTIAYPIALLICLICNLAVDHTLSWFFVVLAALICAYTFIPTVTSFFPRKKLLAFTSSTYLSVCLLLLTCALYTNGLSWLVTACLGVLMGYVMVFAPILLTQTSLSRYKFVISFSATFLLTLLLLGNVSLFHPFDLLPAIGITAYAFAPAIVCTLICATRVDAFFKAGICTALCAVAYVFTDAMIDRLFNLHQSSYQVNFQDWEQCSEGNVYAIILLSLLLLSAVFLIIGISRIRKNR